MDKSSNARMHSKIGPLHCNAALPGYTESTHQQSRHDGSQIPCVILKQNKKKDEKILTFFKCPSTSEKYAEEKDLHFESITSIPGCSELIYYRRFTFQ